MSCWLRTKSSSAPAAWVSWIKNEAPKAKALQAPWQSRGFWGYFETTNLAIKEVNSLTTCSLKKTRKYQTLLLSFLTWWSPMVLKQSSQTLTCYFWLPRAGRCFKTTVKNKWEAVEGQTFPSDRSLGIRVRFLAGPKKKPVLGIQLQRLHVCTSHETVLLQSSQTKPPQFRQWCRLAAFTKKNRHFLIASFLSTERNRKCTFNEFDTGEVPLFCWSITAIQKCSWIEGNKSNVSKEKRRSLLTQMSRTSGKQCETTMSRLLTTSSPSTWDSFRCSHVQWTWKDFTQGHQWTVNAKNSCNINTMMLLTMLSVLDNCLYHFECWPCVDSKTLKLSLSASRCSHPQCLKMVVNCDRHRGQCVSLASPAWSNGK